MSAVLVATGHDVALESLVAVAPEPACPGFQYTERHFGLSGDVVDLGPFYPLNFEMLESGTVYVATLTQFGLHAAKIAPVTVYIENELYTFARFNATAVRPRIGQDGARSNYFLRNFTILLKNLVVL